MNTAALIECTDADQLVAIHEQCGLQYGRDLLRSSSRSYLPAVVRVRAAGGVIQWGGWGGATGMQRLYPNTPTFSFEQVFGDG